MGWTSIKGMNAEEAFKFDYQDYIRDYERVGNVLYCAMRSEIDDTTYGMVVLLEGGMYKPMDEDVGPFYYDCPKRILDRLTPVHPDSDAWEWRSRCWERLG